MRINFDRLSQLAGITSANNRRGLYEGAGHDEMMAEKEMEEAMRDAEEGMRFEGDETEEGMRFEGDETEEGMREEDDDLDELIDVDETMLVQELRRAKRIMQENKRRRLSESRRARNRKQNIFEAQLKQVIDEEVQNVLEELNLNSQWMYGDRRPTRSRRGYTNQGSIMPGFGFKR